MDVAVASEVVADCNDRIGDAVAECHSVESVRQIVLDNCLCYGALGDGFYCKVQCYQAIAMITVAESMVVYACRT